MTAIRPNAKIELDILRFSCRNVVNVHDLVLKIDPLRFVFEEESDVRDEERLFHELLVE